MFIDAGEWWDSKFCALPKKVTLFLFEAFHDHRQGWDWPLYTSAGDPDLIQSHGSVSKIELSFFMLLCNIFFFLRGEAGYNGITLSIYPSFFCLDNTFWTTEPFPTKLCMVMHYHGPECPTKRLGSQFNSRKEKKFALFLINYWPFSYQTLCDETIPQGGAACKMFGFLSLRNTVSVHSKRPPPKKKPNCSIYSELPNFCN